MVEETHICVYGCGQKAKHQLKNGKWCCSKHQAKCPMIRKKNSEVHKQKVIREMSELCEYGCGQKAQYQFYTGVSCCSKNFRNCPTVQAKCKKKLKNIIIREKPELCDYGCGEEAKFYFKTSNTWCCNKTHTRCPTQIKLKKIKNKLNLFKFKIKYPEIFDIEELREVNGNIEAKCKFCNKWFVPRYEQLRGRANSIKNKIRQNNCYFFCTKQCKLQSPDFLSGMRKNPIEVKNLKTYQDEVWRLTNIVIKKYKIKNIELRGRKFKKSLDHMFSIYEGWKNNIDPKIIANINNLEIINERENTVKKTKCSITHEDLLNNYVEP